MPIQNIGLLDLGPSNATSVSQLAFELTLDRLHIHGDAQAGGYRGIALNSRNTRIRNSYLSDFKLTTAASQAICGWNGTRDIIIENNYLEAAGQSLMFGGFVPDIYSAASLPTNIQIRRNHFKKRPEWKGAGWWVKNIFELKFAVNVLIENNVFENNWIEADQTGYAILFTVRGLETTMTWIKIDGVKFQYNIVNSAGAGINILGRDYSHGYIGRANNISIQNNLFFDIDATRWSGQVS